MADAVGNGTRVIVLRNYAHAESVHTAEDFLRDAMQRAAINHKVPPRMQTIRPSAEPLDVLVPVRNLFAPEILTAYLPHRDAGDFHPENRSVAIPRDANA
jgi:hypothetical protein